MREFDIKQHSATLNPPLKHHAVNPPVLSSMQRFQVPRRTILTIDFINFSRASVPGCPSLIFTTGTSIIVMACKNEEFDVNLATQSLNFPGRRALQPVRTEMRTSNKCQEKPRRKFCYVKLRKSRENRLLKEAATSEVFSHRVKGKERRLSGTSPSSPEHYMSSFHPKYTHI